MALIRPNESAPSSPRSFEEIVADLASLTQELIDAAGPAAMVGAGLGSAQGLGSRLTEVSPLLRTVCSQLDVLRMTWLYRIEADGMWALDGSRTFRTWLARREKVTLRTASREVLTAERLLENLPATLAAALSGRLGMDHVRTMVDVGPTSDERRKALVTPVDTASDAPAEPGPGVTDDDAAGADDSAPSDGDGSGDGGGDGGGAGPSQDLVDRPAEDTVDRPTGEELLLDLADQHGPLVFRRFVDRFARVADPESDERGYKRASEREHLDVAKTFGGYHIDGFLTDEHGEALRSAMDSVMGAPTPGDDRTPTQRRAQALADLARTVLDNGHTGTGSAVRPHVTVTVSWTELARLTSRFRATSDGGRTVGTDSTGSTGDHDSGLFAPPTGPTGQTERTGQTGRCGEQAGLTEITAAPARFGISASLVPTETLRRLLCDCAVTRVVFGPDGQVLDVGRSQRTVTGQMRRAVIARDRHCVYVDCTQPPGRCEVHHAERHWADGGETSVRNSALLCYHHHALVDDTGITMRWTGNPDGRRHSGWTLIDRHGREISPAGALPDAARRAA